MKALKIIGAILAVLFMGYLCWGAILPARLEITKTIEVNKDLASTFYVARDFNMYKDWNAWSKNDPEAKNSMVGNGLEVGDKFQWDGEKNGKGELTHIHIEPLKTITNKMEFFTPQPGTGTETWTFEEKDGKTFITLVGKIDNDVSILHRPFMSWFIGSMTQSGLENLKAMAEKLTDVPAAAAPAPAAPAVALEDISEIFYIGIADSCAVSEMENKFATSKGTLTAYIKQNNLESAGAPMGVFSYYDGKTTSFVTALPVKGEVKVKGKIIMGKIPAGKAVAATHVGPYKNSEPVHVAIDKYAKDNKLQTGSAIEIYENDPSTVKPEEIRTKILYPVQG